MNRIGGWRIALWIGLVIIALGFLYLVRGILLPFLLAFALAAILHPLVVSLKKRGWPQPVAITSVLLVFFGTIALLGMWLVPIISGQVVGLKEGAEKVAVGFAQPQADSNYFVRWNPVVQQQATNRDMVDSLLESQQGTLERLGLPSTKRALYAQYIEPQRGQIQRAIRGFFAGFLGLASGLISQVLILLFVPILVVPILISLGDMKRRLFNLVPPSIRPATIAVFEDIGEVFSKYLRGVSIAVLGYMTVMSILLSILGAPYGILLGILFGMVYLVPYFNVVICGITLFAVTAISGTSGGPILHMANPVTFAGTALLIYVIVHLLYDNVAYPQLVGRAVGLDPILSMFVIFSGGALFGLPGMILAFPLAGSIKVILQRLFGVTNRVDAALSLPVVPERHRAVTDVG